MSTEANDRTSEFSAYIDGLLDAAKQKELEDLLSSQEAIRIQFEAFGQSLSYFRNAQTEIQAKCPDLWPELSTKLPNICQLIEEDFSAYLDGELIAPAKEGVSEHLQSCPPCHLKFQNLSQVNGLIAKGLELPESLAADLWSQLKNRLEEDCFLIKEELSNFYDHEVTPQRHRAVTSHLLECPACRDQLSEITQTTEMLRSHYQPEIPEDFDIWPQVKAKIQVLPFSAKEKRRKTLFSRRVSVAAAAVCAGVLAATTFFVNFHSAATIQPMTAESYLIESALGEPANAAEAMVYDNQ